MWAGQPACTYPTNHQHKGLQSCGHRWTRFDSDKNENRLCDKVPDKRRRNPLLDPLQKLLVEIAATSAAQGMEKANR